MKNTINIFFAVDDNYIHLLKVALSSLMNNASMNYKYHVIILHTSLKNSSKKFVKSIKHKNFKISFYDVHSQMENLSKKINVRDYYTLTTYYRLILPKAFPFIKKAIYLDSDIVVKGDISEFYNYDLKDNYVGAVSDTSVQEYIEFATYAEKALEVKKEDYFNAGVLLLNLSKLREINFERKITNLVKNVSFKVAQDQDLLNVVCKGHTLKIPLEWNVMPIGEKIDNPKLIHYNLLFKPWKQDLIMYEDVFWSEAGKANVSDILLESKNNIPKEVKEAAYGGLENVRKLCEVETRNWLYYREGIKSMNKNPEREEVLNKIKLLEKEGRFSEDVENDPPYIPLKPGDVDYLQRKIWSKFKAYFADKYSFKFFNHKIKKGEIVIDGYEGVDVLKNLKSGAIITANHFNPFDSIPLHKIVKKACRKRKLFKIIKEGNYTYPGIYGYFMRNCNTLPLASNIYVLKEMMDATKTHLQNGHLVLIYAEQSMWWNYRKPKPLKPGAFKFAVKANVPVVPTFITMRDTNKLDSDGYPIQAYTLHILDPIYPDLNLPEKQREIKLKEENERVWKELYERVYKTPLIYNE